ncbi:MAG: DPP IV N-terminal domain-containing protein, partial [Parafilimonas sp.]|nr:DPP IV N-terminal domain-containing protein [Parafilimonas sp.]
MKKILFSILFMPFFSQAQLSVEQIMQNPKWIGTSPANVFWGYDSKSVYFNWNPDKNISDSSYSFQLVSNKIDKINYKDATIARDIAMGNYNSAKNKITFIHNDDVYVLTMSTKNITRITNTTEQEFSAFFLKNDNIVVYQLKNNLFAWNSVTGNTEQLTNIQNSSAPSINEELSLQQKWLNEEALQTSSVQKKRKEKADATKQFLDSNKEERQLRTIYIGSKELQNLIISPGERFVTYNLFERNDDAKETIVPSYVTQDGYTKEIPSRSKVGRPAGNYSFYVFDKLKDTVINVSFDSIPFIKYTPEYVKFYPNELKDSNNSSRKVIVQNVLWNDEGTICVIDIFSLDNKDRWIMQLDAATGKLRLLDHQHDEAWIAGPGIAWLEPANIGWINNTTIYFQSEATGYSHLYAYNVSTHQR